jgi:hypothetical protein
MLVDSKSEITSGVHKGMFLCPHCSNRVDPWDESCRGCFKAIEFKWTTGCITTQDKKTAISTLNSSIDKLINQCKANHKEGEQWSPGSTRRYRIINANKGLLDAVNILKEQRNALKGGE